MPRYQTFNSLFEIPESLIAELGFDATLAEKLGVLGKSKDGSMYGYMRDRIIFPIHDLRGRVVAFGGRTIGDGQPKYLNSQATPIFDKSRTLFGIDLAKRAISKISRVIVTEGYMDVISMHIAGFEETVSTLGTAFNDEHSKIIKRFTNLVYLFFDADLAGKNATVSAIQSCLRQGLECRVMTAGDNEDPDDVARQGTDSVNRLIDSSQEAIDFVLSHLISPEKNPQSAVAKSRIAKKALEVVNCSPDAIVRSSYRDNIASFLDIPISTIERFVVIKPKIDNNPKNTRTNFERRIISLMLKDSKIVSRLLEVATSEYFKDTTSQKIFEIIQTPLFHS